MVITTVKVDPNMGDIYLAGLSQSWVKSVKFKKNLALSKIERSMEVICR